MSRMSWTEFEDRYGETRADHYCGECGLPYVSSYAECRCDDDDLLVEADYE